MVSEPTLKMGMRSECQCGCEMNIKFICDAVIIHHAKTDYRRWSHIKLQEVYCVCVTFMNLNTAVLLKSLGFPKYFCPSNLAFIKQSSIYSNCSLTDLWSLYSTSAAPKRPQTITCPHPCLTDGVQRSSSIISFVLLFDSNTLNFDTSFSCCSPTHHELLLACLRNDFCLLHCLKSQHTGVSS